MHFRWLNLIVINQRSTSHVLAQLLQSKIRYRYIPAVYFQYTRGRDWHYKIQESRCHTRIHIPTVPPFIDPATILGSPDTMYPRSSKTR